MDPLDHLDGQFPQLVASIRQRKVNAIELLFIQPSELAWRLKRPQHEIVQFLEAFKRLNDVTESIKSVDNSSQAAAFTTGDVQIDSTLGGGIPCGYLTEVSGGSASGKTNFLWNAAVTIQLPAEFGGLGSSIFDHDTHQSIKTMYISTEAALNTQRLEQITDYYRDVLLQNAVNDESLQPKMENVLTTSSALNDLESQDHCLFYQLPVALERDPEIKMVILDSITHHIRSEVAIKQRDEYVTKVCSHLKRLAKKYNVTMLIANQVTDKPVTGIPTMKNETLYRMNLDYQSGWLSGWDEVGTIYRQLLERKQHQFGDENDDLDEEIGYPETMPTQSAPEQQRVSEVLRQERKRLFTSQYNQRIVQTRTVPALGLALLNMVDARIVLRKEFIPILNEELIDEFSVDLGIDASSLSSTTTSAQKMSEVVASNEYLANNFQTQRFLKVAFSPLVPAGSKRDIKFEIWKGGIRHI